MPVEEFDDVYRQIRVHVDSLTDYARALEQQISAAESCAKGFTAQPIFGGVGFAAAAAVGGRHAEVLAQMRSLLAQVHAGIATGRDAAAAIAERYGDADAFSAARLSDVSANFSESDVRAHLTQGNRDGVRP